MTDLPSSVDVFWYLHKAGSITREAAEAGIRRTINITNEHLSRLLDSSTLPSASPADGSRSNQVSALRALLERDHISQSHTSRDIRSRWQYEGCVACSTVAGLIGELEVGL